MADDIRVVFIKLADRLHNMRTLGHLPEDKQKQIAKETLEIYALLANRLGMSWLKQELEDLCFQYLKTEAYSLLKLRVAKRDEERQVYVQSIIQETVDALAAAGLPGHVVGRPKTFVLHSSENGEPGNYVRGSVRPRGHLHYHRHQEPLLYASRPRAFVMATGPRAVQGLHRHAAHESLPIAAYDGVGFARAITWNFKYERKKCTVSRNTGWAAHWRYKEQVKVAERDEKVFSWLRQFVEWHKDLSDNRQFMDSVKLDLFHLDVFHDVVFAFTPKGEVKETAA